MKYAISIMITGTKLNLKCKSSNGQNNSSIKGPNIDVYSKSQIPIAITSMIKLF
jgi:hypothetical protein